MPFLSGGRRGGSGSLLPTKRKPPSAALRRRNTSSRPFSSNFFIIGLSISLLFFLAIIIRYGVPSSLSHSKPPIIPRPIQRPPIRHIIDSNINNLNQIGSARVDITTKDLYDKIEFADVDGGAWKQGWEVTYNGDEWDKEKLKVFVVPHSHNDPGWKLTVEEYYNRQSRHILDTIVDSLSKDIRRKFIWEEMSYLERWWRDASDKKRDGLSKLVRNGQLEIVGGGWVMNDEIMEGNRWLNETLNFTPKNSWAIDPFGYSSTMAYLLRRMGFSNMLIQRTHYELKKELALNKNLEFTWRQNWDSSGNSDIFVHMMPFYSYDVPHTCGPEPAVCCQFDFARKHKFGYELCPWRVDPVETNVNNVRDRAVKLLDQYRKKSTLYRSNSLLVPLGDDFRYVSLDEAEIQFNNYQMIFDFINSEPDLNAEVKFGTLEDYFRSVRDETGRVNYTRDGEIGSDFISGFPSLSGDFFTYADRNKDYWSGYYVSRPFFKAVDRVLEQTLRASEMMSALILGFCQRNPCSKLSINFTHKLTAARRNLALFQHHDGVTGTAKDHVVEDYGNRMHFSLNDLNIFNSKAVEILLSDFRDKFDVNSIAQFEPEITRSKYDVQPVHKIIDLNIGEIQKLVFFNPLEQKREEIVMVVVKDADVAVLDSNGSCLKSQLSPAWQHDGKKIVFTGEQRLYFRASVPALGLETYYIAKNKLGCENAIRSVLKFRDLNELFSCPDGYKCSKLEGSTTEIFNKKYTLTFDLELGLLKKLTEKINERETILDEEISMYTSFESGAYLFKPEGEAKSIIDKGGKFVISQGDLVQEFYAIPRTKWGNSPVSHSTRVYNYENTLQEFIIEKEYHVELLGHDFNDRELIVRYKTNIDNNRVFYSDLNGFQMSRRETYDKVPLQGNYYPMPSLAFLQDNLGNRVSVHSKQSLGCASLKNGFMEMMLDRRLIHDDGRGLGQGVMDNKPMNVIFHIVKENNVSNNYDNDKLDIMQPSLLSHRIGANLNYPMHKFISKKKIDKIPKINLKRFEPLNKDLPCDLHIVSLKVPQPSKFHQVLEDRFAILLQRRGWDANYCKKGGLNCKSLKEEGMNLYYLFKDLGVSDVKASSLNLLHDDVADLGYIEQVGDLAKEGNVVISPMEIQAYKFDIVQQEQ